MVVWIAIAGASAGPLPGAGNAGLAACCAAVGGGACPDTVKVTGTATAQIVSPQGTQVTGLWTISCDSGATWDPVATQTTSNPFPPATVLTPMMPSAGACFDASCRLPEGTCVRYDGKRLYVASCTDGAAASDLQLQHPPRVPRGAVVVAGRVLGSQPIAGQGPVAAAGPSSFARGGPMPGMIASPPLPAPAPAVGGVDATVPPMPPDKCIPSASLREPSNQQVDAGNEAILTGDFATALDRYRAAITINKCNAFAWAALGDALLQSGNAGPARMALDAATRLMPTNFHAWTQLGQAAERTGDRAGAASAYQKALAQKPGHAPAAEGLSRVQ